MKRQNKSQDFSFSLSSSKATKTKERERERLTASIEGRLWQNESKKGWEGIWQDKSDPLHCICTYVELLHHVLLCNPLLSNPLLILKIQKDVKAGIFRLSLSLIRLLNAKSIKWVWPFLQKEQNFARAAIGTFEIWILCYKSCSREEYLRRFRWFVSAKVKEEPFECPCPKERRSWRRGPEANRGLCFTPHVWKIFLFVVINVCIYFCYIRISFIPLGLVSMVLTSLQVSTLTRNNQKDLLLSNHILLFILFLLLLFLPFNIE